MTARGMACLFAVPALAFCVLAAGCGQATPEQAVYKFLGAVQSHDRAAMRSCVNPGAVEKVAEGKGGLARQWDELHRRYEAEPADWRMEFEGIRLESSYLDRDRALVRLVGGSCELYDLEKGKWIPGGKIDFAVEDFVPLYLVMKEGKWYLEALDLYVIYGLESAART